MSPRFTMPVVTLALALAVVVGIALLAALGAAVGEGLPAPTVAVLGRFLAPVVLVLALGTLAGVVGWLVLFLLGRDGFHRMEWVALLPYNYGSRSPFDTTHWPAK